MSLCPICHKALPEADPTAKKFRPFCSRRCADVDLHRWLGGVYSIPGDERVTDADPSPTSDSPD